jgi:hypothetical protein
MLFSPNRVRLRQLGDEDLAQTPLRNNKRSTSLRNCPNGNAADLFKRLCVDDRYQILPRVEEAAKKRCLVVQQGVRSIERDQPGA